jgi:two-component sensor histidine kinase
LYLNAHIKNFTALLGLLVLFHSCTRFDLDDYIFDDLPAKTEAQLKSMADTSIMLPRIAALSKRQQVDTLIYYAEWLKNYDDDIALSYAEQAYDLATEKNWNMLRGVSANRIATIKGWQAEYGEDIEDAIVDARISRRLLSPHHNAYWQVDIDNLFGFLFKRGNELDSARLYFEKALLRIEDVNVDKKIVARDKAVILHNLATTHPMKDSILHINYYRQTDSIYQSLNNKENRARLWLDWGIFYQFHDTYQKADSLFDLCIEYGTDFSDKELLSKAFIEKGYSYYRKYNDKGDITDFVKAIDNLKLALQIEEKESYRIYDIMGNVFQDSWANYVDDSHLDSAFLYYKLAMIKAREAGAIKTMKELSSNMASLYRYGGENAFNGKLETFLNQNYIGIVDTLTNRSQIAYQRINKVEQRDIRASESSKRQNQLLISLAILFLAVTIFAFAIQQQQNQRLRAEMQALRAQINPHFISNSLNAIESLVNLGNTKAASKYLVHFSRLSRQILTGSRTSITSLSEELKTLKHFLALEQLRFKDKLTYDIHVEPEVESYTVQVPAMILQPYAENAIWHGIKPKPDGGHVQVNVKKEGKELICIVEDNGIGRAQSRKLKEASVMKHKSMGMKITEDRIKAMGRVKGSQVEVQDLKDENGNATGTRVVIRLPYKLK